MNAQRDIIIERLEQKLREKEKEVKNVRDSLKNEVLTELRAELESSQELLEKIIRLEKRVAQVDGQLEGVMNELLDQKAILKELRASSPPEQPIPPRPNQRHRPKPEIKPPSFQNISTTEPMFSVHGEDSRPAGWPDQEKRVRMTVREHPPEQRSAQPRKSEYIVARTIEEPAEEQPVEPIHEERKTEYIIAEQKSKSPNDDEMVTTREDQDVVIMERRKG